jgi:hypothetical protein
LYHNKNTTTTNRLVVVASEKAVDYAEEEDFLPFKQERQPQPKPSVSSTTSSLTFIGGAERARQMARKKLKKQACRIVRPGATTEPQASSSSSQILPRRMNAFERFFAALLRSPILDFEENHHRSNDVWETACARLGILPPSQPIRSSIPYPGNNNNVDTTTDTEDTYLSQVHFESRAALIVEEARYALAQNLQRIKTKQQQRNRQHHHPKNNPTAHPMGIRMTARILETNQHGHTKCMFQPVATTSTTASKRNFSSRTNNKDMYDVRPGCVWKFVSCHDHHRDGVVGKEWLGVVVSAPSWNRGIDSTSTTAVRRSEPTPSFPCLLFQEGTKMEFDHPSSEFWAIPVVPLITEFRCYEATMIPPRAIAFLHPLLGRKGPVHTRLDHPSSSDDEEVYYSIQKNRDNNNDPPNNNNNNQGRSQVFRLPILNDTQETVATTFLQSKPNTITLVQGPPGTVRTNDRSMKDRLNCTLDSYSCRKYLPCSPSYREKPLYSLRLFVAISWNHYPTTA